MTQYSKSDYERLGNLRGGGAEGRQRFLNEEAREEP